MIDRWFKEKENKDGHPLLSSGKPDQEDIRKLKVIMILN